MDIENSTKDLRKITPQQKIVLRSIALEGSANIQTIQIREKMKYPTTHRSVKSLEKRGLIWLSKKQDRGPKSAQEFSLTPLGVIASILECDLFDKTKIITQNWKDITPKFVRYWGEFIGKGLQKELVKISNEVYLSISLLILERNPKEMSEKALIIRRNSLDLHFLTSFYLKYSGGTMDKVADIIKMDSAYKEVWGRWFSIQKFKMNYLVIINEQFI